MMKPRLTPEEERLITDLTHHALDQCEQVIERVKSLAPSHLKHHISVNVVAGLSATAMADTLWVFKTAFPRLPPPSFERTLDAVFDRIKKLAMESPAVKAARKSGLSS